MSRLTKQRNVQDRLIHYLQGLHWTFVPRYDLPASHGDERQKPFLRGGALHANRGAQRLGGG